MIKSQDKLAPIFRSLHPDESVMTKAVSASAQEAAEKWPLFRVLAPRKTMSTPALSEVDKQNRLSPHSERLMPQPSTLAVVSLGEKLADGLTKMTGRNKPLNRQPKRAAQVAEQATTAQAKPIAKPTTPERHAQQVSEKLAASLSEFANEHKAQPAPVTETPAVLAAAHGPTASVMPSRAVLPPQATRKSPAPTKAPKEAVSEPVLHKAPVQPIAAAHKTPEPAAPIQQPQTTGSIKSLFNKLQNPVNASPLPEAATEATATVKAPAFLNRLFKK